MADASAAEAADGQAPMDVDAAAQALATVHAQLAAAKADLAVAKAHSAAVPKGALKQPDHFHGKPSEKFADYLLSWEAFQTASGSDRACWASYLITFMQGTALTYLRAKFGSALFSATYEQLVEALKEAQWGRTSSMRCASSAARVVSWPFPSWCMSSIPPVWNARPPWTLPRPAGCSLMPCLLACVAA